MSLEVVGRSQHGSWTVTSTRGSVAGFHALELPAEPRREVWLHEPDGAALVLGSTQPEAVVDPSELARRGVSLVRRHSGGGAVLVEPGALSWVDVILPAGDPLWEIDVARAFSWLGDAWAAALAAVGVAGRRYEGPMHSGEWGRLVCFAGLGPGEVTAPRAQAVGARGPKLVGLAQRRTRRAARFQCAALHRWDPARLVCLLALSSAERARAMRALAQAAAPVDAAPAALLAALLAALP